MVLEVHAVHPVSLHGEPGHQLRPGSVQAKVGAYVIRMGLYYHVLTALQPDVTKES